MTAASQSPSPAKDRSAGGASPPRFKVSNVLLVVVPLALILAAGLAWLRFGNLETLLGDLTRPTLVRAMGQVTFGGRPLAYAQVKSEPIDGRGWSTVCRTNDEGRFTLMTAVWGTYYEGATLGEHRVTVAARENTAGPGDAPLVTPPQYASMQTTPFRITVVKEAEKNEFQLVLEGGPAAPGGRGGGGRGGRGRRGGRGGRGGEPAETTPAGAESGSPDGAKPEDAKTDETKAVDAKADQTKSEDTSSNSPQPESAAPKTATPETPAPAPAAPSSDSPAAPPDSSGS